jgi:hypothetical protein
MKTISTTIQFSIGSTAHTGVLWKNPKNQVVKYMRVTESEGKIIKLSWYYPFCLAEKAS